MINAIIESKGNTLVTELPIGIYTLYERLLSVGISANPKTIRLTDNEEDDIRVKLYSESDFGNHLLRVLDEENTLADANLLTAVVQNAHEEIRDDIEQNILYDQYTSMNEVIDDIRTMTANTGPIKVTFYCPLVGTIEDDEGLSSSVGGRFLHSYQWAIEDAIEIDRRSDDVDMAEYFNNDDGVKAKLVSAKWGVEDYRGRLFGKIECSLKEELTDAETEILTDWICGQNSDGWGEGFEQHPIDTEDGDLYVSFWNSNDDYDIMTHDELDAYIDNQGMRMGGM